MSGQLQVDSCVHIVYTRNMKTITLDDEAYALLKAWKRAPRDSFSSVVKQVVPRPGTLASLLSYVESHPSVDVEADNRLEESVELRSTTKEDPWTS